MTAQTSGSTFDYIKLIVENISLWPLIVVFGIYWLSRHPELLNYISKISFAGWGVELRDLKAKVEENRQQIKVLENDIERERDIFGELLRGFDAAAPLEQLAETRSMIKAHARQMENLAELEGFLRENAKPEEVYAVAVTLRERRPTGMFRPLVDYLSYLADRKDLGGIRLNTVWTLTSALHRMLIASIKDNVTPSISKDEMSRAKEVLERLEKNPRVQADRPDNPEKGIRGPIRLSQEWIRRGLQKN